MKSLTLLNQESVDKYRVKPVYKALLQSSRKIENDKLFAGQSFSLYPKNCKEHVKVCLEAFKWESDELIGNKTIEQVLEDQIDLVTKKVNMQKLLAGQKVSPEA